MEKELKNYITTQQKHFDALSLLIPDAKQVLADLVISNNQTVDQITSTLKQIKGYSKENEDALIKLIKDKHFKQQEYNNTYTDFINTNNLKLKENIATIDLLVKEFQQQTNVKINNLLAQKRDSSSFIQGEISHFKKELAQTNIELKEDFEEIKRLYLKKINEIYEQKESSLRQIDTLYSNLLEDYHRVNKKRIRQQAERVNLEQNFKDEFLEFHKNDLVDARQNFYRILAHLNTKINEIQAKYKLILQQSDDEFKQLKNEISKDLTEFSNNINEKNQTILDEFEIFLKDVDGRIETLRNQFHNSENELKKRYNRAVTSFNVLLHNEKEIMDNKIVELKENLQADIQENVDDISKVVLLEKTFNKRIKLLNNTYNEYKKHIDVKLNDAKKTYQKELLLLENKYVEEVEAERLLRRTQDKKKNLKIKENRDILAEKEQYTFEILKKHTKQKEINDGIVEAGMQLEILPLDIQSTLASYIYTTESNFYQYDQNYVKENFSRQIDIIEKRSYSRELILLRTRDRIYINNESENKRAELNHYFNMENEKNKRNHEEMVFNQQQKINQSIYDINVLRSKHKQETQVEHINSEMETLNLLLNLKLEKYTLESALLKEKSNYLNLSEQQILYKKTNGLNINHNIKQTNLNVSKELKVIREQRKIITSIEQLIKKLVLSTKGVPLKSLSIEEISETVFHQQEIIESMVSLLIFSIGETQNLSVRYFEQQLNIVNDKEYVDEHQKILNKFENDVAKIEQDIDDIAAKLNDYGEQRETVNNKIFKLENENESLIRFNVELQHRITKYKEDKVGNEHFIKNTQLEIKSNLKHIQKNKESVKVYKLQRNQIGLRIILFNRSIEKLSKQLTTLDITKENRLKTLEKNVNKSGKVFHNAINLINNMATNLYETIKDNQKSLIYTLHLQNNNAELYAKEFHKFNHKLVSQQQQITAFYEDVYKLIHNLHKQSLDKEQKTLSNLERHYDNSFKAFKKEHDDNLKKINSNIIDLERYQNKTVHLAELKLKKSITVFKNNQRHEIKTLELKKSSLENELASIQANYEQFVRAFNLNKQQALNVEQNNLKEILRKTEKENLRQFNISQQQIKEASEEISDADRRRDIQMDFIAHTDKENRRKLVQKLTASTNQFENRIISLKKMEPPLLKEMAQCDNVLYRSVKRIENKTRRQIKFSTFMLKLLNLFEVRRKKNELKKEKVN